MDRSRQTVVLLLLAFALSPARAAEELPAPLRPSPSPSFEEGFELTPFVSGLKGQQHQEEPEDIEPAPVEKQEELAEDNQEDEQAEKEGAQEDIENAPETEDEDIEDSEDSEDDEESDKTSSEPVDPYERAAFMRIEPGKRRDPGRHLKLVKVFIKQKQYKDALLELNKCLKISPSSWEAHYLGAFIYQLQGRTDEAIERYRHFLKVRPNDQKALINLGTLLRGKRELKEAESLYRKVIGLNFYSFHAHYNLANVLIDLSDLEGALKELKICEKLKPSNAWVHNNLGVLYQKRSYFEEAEEEFLRAITLEPANKTFETNLQLLRKHRDSKAAQKDVLEWM